MDMKKKPELVWTKFLSTEKMMNNPYEFYEDGILYQCENLVGKITKEYLIAYPTTSVENAKKIAINLILQQMLSIQYDHSPQEQAAMGAELFVNLPKLSDFRHDLVKEIKISNTYWYRVKNFFKSI